jgi:hypothetical protein
MELLEAYVLLGARSDAAAEEIRQEYLQLVKVWHPDRFQGDPILVAKAEAKLKLLNEAFRLVQHAPLRNQAHRAAAPEAIPREQKATVASNNPSTGRVLTPAWKIIFFLAVVSLLPLIRTPRPETSAEFLALAVEMVTRVMGAVLLGSAAHFLTKWMHPIFAVVLVYAVVGGVLLLMIPDSTAPNKPLKRAILNEPSVSAAPEPRDLPRDLTPAELAALEGNTRFGYSPSPSGIASGQIQADIFNPFEVSISNLIVAVTSPEGREQRYSLQCGTVYAHSSAICSVTRAFEDGRPLAVRLVAGRTTKY